MAGNPLAEGALGLPRESMVSNTHQVYAVVMATAEHVLAREIKRRFQVVAQL